MRAAQSFCASVLQRWIAAKQRLSRRVGPQIVPGGVASLDRGTPRSATRALPDTICGLQRGARTKRQQALSEQCTFRGSLGDQKSGHDGFIEYVDDAHRALSEYRCVIEELVAENDKVFAKMLFTGIHRGRFMGVEPTQRRVNWHGCALFSFDGDLINDVWVLGNLQPLKQQLHA
ncbi:ester cyclase [Salinisphaera sp. SWV1]|uniref:ester cyclase n=1 Tax=Salinisphaera sp. SWV1 TaxID=3454139 RepID=UPI003F83FBDE